MGAEGEPLSFSLCDDCGTWASSLESMIGIAVLAGAVYLVARLLLALRDRVRE